MVRTVKYFFHSFIQKPISLKILTQIFYQNMMQKWRRVASHTTSSNNVRLLCTTVQMCGLVFCLKITPHTMKHIDSILYKIYIEPKEKSL